jgi:transcription antitermination factor NusG
MPTVSELPAALGAPEGGESVADLRGRWWVLQAPPRHAKALAWDLADRGIGYYLPMVEVVRLLAGKKRRLYLPVFPGYVFACSDRYGTDYSADGLRWALREDAGIDRLCGVIDVPAQGRLVEQLSTLQRALMADPRLTACQRDYVRGTAVEIQSGPFEGLRGVVEKFERPTSRVYLLVDMMGRGVELEVEAGDLAPLN